MKDWEHAMDRIQDELDTVAKEYERLATDIIVDDDASDWVLPESTE